MRAQRKREQQQHLPPRGQQRRPTASFADGGKRLALLSRHAPGGGAATRRGEAGEHRLQPERQQRPDAGRDHARAAGELAQLSGLGVKARQGKTHTMFLSAIEAPGKVVVR